MLQSPIQRVISALQNQDKSETVEAGAEEVAAPAVEETPAEAAPEAPTAESTEETPAAE